MKFQFFNNSKLSHRCCRGPRRRNGQAMIETGLVISALLLLSIGMLQYALIYNAMLTLNNMAREGARWASVRATTETVKSDLVKYLQGRASGTTVAQELLTNETVALEIPTAASQSKDKEVRVTITYNMKTNKQFLPALVPLPESWRTYRATGANVLEGAAPAAASTPAPAPDPAPVP